MPDNEVRLVFRITDDGTIQVLDQAGNKVKELGGVLDTVGKSGASAFSALGAGIVVFNQALGLAERGLHLVEGAVDSVVAQADKIRDLGNAAKGIGLTATELSSLQLAAAEAGLDVESLGFSVGILSTKIAEAHDPTSKAAQLFRAFGIDIKQGTLPILIELGKAFDRLPEGANKVAVSRALLGRGGARELALLTGELEKQIALNTELGATIDAKTAAAFKRTAGNVDEAKLALEALGEITAAKVLPVVDSLAEALLKTAISGQHVAQAAPSIFTSLITGAEQALPVLREVDGIIAQIKAEYDKLPAKTRTNITDELLPSPLASFLKGARGIAAQLPPLPPTEDSSLITAAVGQVKNQLDQKNPLNELVTKILSENKDGINKALEAADRSRDAYAQALATQGKTALTFAEQELDVFQRQVKQRQELASTDLERRDIALSAYQQELDLAKKVDDLTIAKLEAEKGVNNAKALGSKATDGDRAELTAQNKLLDVQEQIIETTGGKVAEVADQYARVTAAAKQANQVTVDLAETVDNSLQRAVTGGLSGGKNSLIDLVKGTGEGIVSSLVGGFLKAKLEKDKFDAHLSENFTVTLPGFMKTGADQIGSIWSHLMSFFRFSSDQAASGVQQSFADTFRSIGSGAQNASQTVAGLTDAASSASAVLQSTPGQAAGVSRLAAQGFSADQIASLQQGALAGTSAGAATGSTSALGGLGSLAGYGALIYAAFQVASGLVKGFKASRQLALQGGSTTDLSSKAFSQDPAGQLWAGLLGEKTGGQVNYIALTAGIGPVLDSLGVGLFQAKTQGTIIGHGLAKALRQAGLPQQNVFQGGSHGIAALVASPSQDITNQFVDLGFGGLPGINQTFESLGAEARRNVGKDNAAIAAGASLAAIPDPLIAASVYLAVKLFGSGKRGHPGRNNRAFNLLTAAARAEPGVEALRTNEALGLAAVLEPGPGAAFGAANALTNNELLLGVKPDEAKRQLRQLAESQGINLLSGLQDINNKYLTGKFKDRKRTPQNEAVEQATASITGLTKLFSDDLPRGIDVAGLAMKNFAEHGGLDIAAFQKELDALIAKFGAVQDALKGGLTTGGVTAIQQYVQAAQIKAQYPGGPASAGNLAALTLQQTARQTLTQSLTTAASQGLTQGLVTDALNKVQQSDAYKALQDKTAAVLNGGDASGIPDAIKALVDSSLPLFQTTAETIAQINQALEDSTRAIAILQATQQTVEQGLRTGLTAGVNAQGPDAIRDSIRASVAAGLKSAFVEDALDTVKKSPAWVTLNKTISDAVTGGADLSQLPAQIDAVVGVSVDALAATATAIAQIDQELATATLALQVLQAVQQTTEQTLGTGLSTALEAGAKVFSDYRALTHGATGTKVADVIADNRKFKEAIASTLADSVRDGLIQGLQTALQGKIEDLPEWKALQQIIANTVNAAFTGTGGVDLTKLSAGLGDLTAKALPLINAAAEAQDAINKTFAQTPYALQQQADAIRADVKQQRLNELTPAQRQQKDLTDLNSIDRQLAAGNLPPDQVRALLDQRNAAARDYADTVAQRYDLGTASGKRAYELALAQESKTADLFEQFGIKQQDVLSVTTDNTTATTRNTAAIETLNSLIGGSTHVTRGAGVGTPGKPSIPPIDALLGGGGTRITRTATAGSAPTPTAYERYGVSQSDAAASTVAAHDRTVAALDRLTEQLKRNGQDTGSGNAGGDVLVFRNSDAQSEDDIARQLSNAIESGKIRRTALQKLKREMTVR